MSQSLINLEKHDGEMRISSMAFVEHSGVTYKATNNLIKKHRERLECFGSLPFEKAAKSKTGQEIHAFLNEDQAYFLLTLSKNSEQVVDFKHRLVTAFSKLRRKQALIDANHAKAEWQQNRQLGKYQRKDITDTIQQFIDYAKAQGSRGAPHYFANITKCVNKALSIEDRDKASEDTLHLLATAEVITERVLLDGMRDVLPYKNIYSGLKSQMATFAGMAAEREPHNDESPADQAGQSGHQGSLARTNQSTRERPHDSR